MGSRRKKQGEYEYKPSPYSQVEIDRRAALERGPEDDSEERGMYQKMMDENPITPMVARETAWVDLAPAERYGPLIKHNMNQVRHIMFALDDRQLEIRQLRSGTRQVLDRLGAAA